MIDYRLLSAHTTLQAAAKEAMRDPTLNGAIVLKKLYGFTVIKETLTYYLYVPARGWFTEARAAWTLEAATSAGSVTGDVLHADKGPRRSIADK
eukprot:7388348-Prymnesium_polylepis.1